MSISNSYVSRGDNDAIINWVPNNATNMNNNIIEGIDDDHESAFVNFTNTNVQVDYHQVYSSLHGIKLSNSTRETYYKTFKMNTEISDETVTYYENILNEINHSELSEPNNEMFDKWSYTWSRVSQKNNNYPVLLFINGSWIGIEPFNNGDTYTIESPANLAWIADQVNSGNTCAGKTINFAVSELDFQKKLWNPIGHSETNSFQGTVNFGDLTIKNLTTNGYYKNNIYFMVLLS